MNLPRPKSPSLLHNLGSFFGHILRGVKTDPLRGVKIARREQVTEQPVPGADPRVTLRRTVIDEVFVEPLEDRQQF